MSEERDEIIQDVIYAVIGAAIGMIPWIILSLKYDT